MTSAAFSWLIATSTRGSTTSPAVTSGRPAARARIFSTTVLPMGISLNDSLGLQARPRRPGRSRSGRGSLRCGRRGAGGGASIDPGVFSSFAVRLKSGSVPIPGVSTSARVFRWTTCGCFSAASSVRMSPEGTSFAFRRSTQSAVGFSASFSSRSGVSAWRFFFRVSRSANRGSVFSSGTPRTSQTDSHCSCLFAAMLTKPSFVRKVPDGAAVKLSFPMATGALPADEEVRGDPSHERHDRVEERDVDGLPLARPLAVVERGEDRERGVHPADGVADGEAGPERVEPLVAVHVHLAARAPG